MNKERNFGKLLLEQKTKSRQSQIILTFIILFFAVLFVVSIVVIATEGIRNVETEFIIAPFTSAAFIVFCVWKLKGVKLTSARLYEFGLKFRHEGVKAELLFSEISDVQDENETIVSDTTGNLRMRGVEEVYEKIRTVIVKCKENKNTFTITNDMLPRFSAFADALVMQYRKYRSGENADKTDENGYENFWKD